MAISPAESNGTSHHTEALYREHEAAVAALCGSLLRDRGETEDATQQVFLSAHRALLNGARPRDPRAWLLAVARNECYARFRQRAATPVPAGDAPETATADASVQAVRAGELANMWDEVERMPPRQREAFILREIRGLSYGQLADELSLSRPSVRSLLLRARMRLRRRLGDVAAGLGGAPWLQALVRLVTGGDGASSPLSGATKAAAVGIGALALAGGGGLVARHPSAATPRHRAAHHRVASHEHRVAAPATTPVARVEDRAPFADRSFAVDRSRGRDGGSRESGERSGSSGESSSGSSSGSGHDGSDDTAAVAEPSTDGPGGGGGGSSSSGPGSGGSSSDSSSSSGKDGSGGGSSTSGSTSGSDDGSGSVTTTTSSDSGSGGSGSGSDSGSSDGGSSGGSDGDGGSGPG